MKIKKWERKKKLENSYLTSKDTGTMNKVHYMKSCIVGSSVLEMIVVLACTLMS